jgi:Leucine-rich repeat (LRR) protein
MRFAVLLSLTVSLVSPISLRAQEKADPQKLSPAETAAVAKIQALGGAIQRQSDQGAADSATTKEKGDPVFLVNFIGNEKITDDDLQCLQAFPDLEHLYLGRTKIGDAGLAHIKGLKHLKRLGLIGTRTTDAGLKELEGLQELTSILLSDTKITDAGLVSLCKLKNLQSLILVKTNITGAGLKDADGLPRLTDLYLINSKFNDAGAAELAKCPNLEDLSLASTSISDAGTKHLAKLQHLKSLDLRDTRVTDGGLEPLGQIKSLKTLLLAGTQVTDDGKKRLAALLPHASFKEQQQLGQRTDPDFDVFVAHPAYTAKHPTVLFDEAHNNFHTASGRYKVFADLITNDGVRVTPNTDSLTPELLGKYDVFITANAPAKSEESPSAFTPAECDAVESWVRNGGALLLITDHEPFGSGSAELGKRFGVDMSLMVSVDPKNETKNGLLFSREKNLIGDHPIMNGRDQSERINRVLTFTGQSLKGPAESVQLLKFSDTATDMGYGRGRKKVSAAGRAQGIAFKFGKGRVVVMGEAGDLSAQIYGSDPVGKMGMNVPGCDNRQFALNIIHWLTGLID